MKTKSFVQFIVLGFLTLSSCNKEKIDVESEGGIDLNTVENSFNELVLFKQASAELATSVGYSLFETEETITTPAEIRKRMKESLINIRGEEYKNEITELVDNSSYGYFLSDSIIINSKVVRPLEKASSLKSNDTINNAINVFEFFLEGLTLKLEFLKSDNEDTIVNFILEELDAFEYECLTDKCLSENDKIALAASSIIIRDNIASVVKYAVNYDGNLKSLKCTIIERVLSTIIDLVFLLAGATGGVALGGIVSPALSAILGGIGAVFGVWVANQITLWIFNC